MEVGESGFDSRSAPGDQDQIRMKTSALGAINGPCKHFSMGLGLLLALYLTACAINPAPVSSRAQPPSEKLNHHVVAPGDTLFSIAWRYEKDMAALARSNGLAPPYRLMPGQRLTLDTSVVAKPRRSTAETATVKKPVKPVQNSTKTGINTETHPAPTPSVPATRPAREMASTNTIVAPAGGKLHWQWPVKGAVSRHYDRGRVFKGINIQALPGRDVHAAADGIVVYAGSGLRGYGKLIIIKHSDVYLSAYAHNKAIAVREGERVKGGRKVGSVGGDPNNRGRLYFELRKNGKPIDPTRLLPRL